MKKRFSVVLIALCLLTFTACGNKLSQKEIDRANEAFAHEIITENFGGATEISCFFTCYYADPREIDLWKFLQYCPAHVMLTDGDEEEFLDWLEAAQWPDYGKTYTTPNEFHVPVWRYTKSDVSAILRKYTGITVDDLNSIGDTVYMEKYDSFYNMTSDFGPGRFEAVGGETDGAFVRFWSVPDQQGNRDVLTIENVDGQYLIRSFLREKAS